MLQDIGHSADSRTAFRYNEDLLSKIGRSFSDLRPKIIAVMGHIQTEAVNAEFPDVPKPGIYPPYIQIRMVSVPVIILHSPGFPGKPVRMLLNQRAVLHHPMGYHIQEYPDSAAVRVLYQASEILLRSQGGIDSVGAYAGIFRPDIIKMSFPAKLMPTEPDTVNPQLLQIGQLLLQGCEGP